MRTTSRHVGTARRLTALVIGIALLASCGTSDAVTTEDSAGYTIDAGDTLSGIADRAGVSVADIVTANGWPDGSDHLILPGDVIRLPQGSSSVSPRSTSPVITTATNASGSPAAPASGGYEQSATPTFGALRLNQKSEPILDPLADGQYWSWDYNSDGKNVSFTLVQYFFGDACREQFGDDEYACASDNETLYTPSATVELDGTAATSVISCCDGEGRYMSYRVSTSEFARLVAGLASGADAPAGFAYERSGAVVTVRNGRAVAVDQVFTS